MILLLQLASAGVMARHGLVTSPYSIPRRPIIQPILHFNSRQHPNHLFRRSCLGESNRGPLVICRGDNGFMDHSAPLDGPLESPRPKFSRLPHSSLSFIPVDDPAATVPPAAKIEIKTRRGRRIWKKITVSEAMLGAFIGGLWAALAFKGTTLAYEHLDSHPLTRDLPMGLTNKVNQLLLTSVTAFGGFAVVLFGASSLGLSLLTMKLLSASTQPKEPPQ